MKNSTFMAAPVDDEKRVALASRETFVRTTAPPNCKLGHYPRRAPRKSRMLPTAWAKVGGEDIKSAPTNAFAAEAFLDRYQPGEWREIYAGACRGLGLLARKAAMPLYKISTCGAGRLDERMFELRRDRYGACRFGEGGYLVENGWDSWFPSHLRPSQAASPKSPVVIDARCLKVRLPCTMTSEEFDYKFDALTRKGAIDIWAMSEDARRHCAFLGIEPSVLQRFTAYPGWRLSPAQEICGFSIFSGADRLVALAERIILDHFGLEA